MIVNAFSRDRAQGALARRCRAWIDGQEITSRCYYADDARGVVRVYKLNDEGKKYQVNGEVATEELQGAVELTDRGAWAGLMATAALRPCLSPGCPVRSPASRCPAHSTQREQQRGTAKARGYGAEWRRARGLFLLRYPLCGMRPASQSPVMSQCHDEGRTTPATQVDHVRPHRGDLVLFWASATNWQAMCGQCHSRKTQAGQ